MVNIQLQDSVAAALTARASAEGLSLEAYLERLAEIDPGTDPSTISGETLVRLFEEASVDGPPSNTTYTRSDIYLDHD